MLVFKVTDADCSILHIVPLSSERDAVIQIRLSQTAVFVTAFT